MVGVKPSPWWAVAIWECQPRENGAFYSSLAGLWGGRPPGLSSRNGFLRTQILFHAEQSLGQPQDLHEILMGTMVTVHVAFWEIEFEGTRGCSDCCWRLAETGGRDATGVKSISLW